MKGVEKIKKTIMQDAQDRAKQIKSEANKEASKIKAQENERLAVELKKFTTQTNLLVENYEHRTLANARLESRKALLQKRETIIEAAINEAIKKIDHKSKEYEKQLKEKLEDAKKQLHATMTIHCDKQDTTLLNKLIKATVEEAPITAGFIATDKDGRRIDESLETWLSEKRAQIRTQAAKILGD